MAVDAVRHLEVLVEEPSARELLMELLPRIVGDEVSVSVYVFQGKMDLLARLTGVLRGYRSWLHEGWRIVVLVDRDDDDCRELKRRMEGIAADAGLKTPSRTGGLDWQVVNRIVVSELESWFLGDVPALRAAYPRVPPSLSARSAYRDPDTVPGGASEALSRVLRQAGYHRSGLRKIEAAQLIAPHMDPYHKRSHSFCLFRDTLRALVSP